MAFRGRRRVEDGAGMADRIEQLTKEVFVGAGIAFSGFAPAGRAGLDCGRQGGVANGVARNLRLTASERRQLAEEKRSWRKVTTAVNQVLAGEG